MTLMLLDRQPAKSPATPSKNQLFDPAQSSQPREAETVHIDPVIQTTTQPTLPPTTAPTVAPTTQPTVAPTTQPTVAPTTQPTVAPTTQPTAAPTTKPTDEHRVYRYTIKFRNEDGSILSEKNYYWGDIVTEPTAPTKAEDGAYTYTFAGWDKPVVPCQGNATYTATYTRQEKGPAFVSSGKCGENLTWTLKEDGTLTISGTGTMGDFDPESSPWYSQRQNVKTVIIESGVTSIGCCAFLHCNGLTSVAIPDSVTSIGDSAFSGCSSLTSIRIPDRVTYLGIYAFYECFRLKDITIPGSVTIINLNMFSFCSSLTSITIPDGVTLIDMEAFTWCSNLTSISLPASICYIGFDAFFGCTSLTNVFYAGTEAQKNQISFGTTNDALTSAQWHCADADDTGVLTFTLNQDGAGYSVTDCDQYAEGELAIPSTYKGLPVTGIGDEAFSGCSSLTSITIPDSVTSIGDHAFDGCTSLTNVFYAGTEAQRDQIVIGSNNDALTSATWSYKAVD